MRASGLEEHRGSPVELVAEFLRVDFGHLENGDTTADDEEGEDESDDLGCGRAEALEEDNSRDHREERNWINVRENEGWKATVGLQIT